MKEPVKQHPSKRATIAFGTLAAVLALLYSSRPDWAMCLHWWPIVIWTPLVLFPLISREVKQAFGRQMMCMAVWALVVLFVGEPSWRVVLPPKPKESGWYRVVSLNCGTGSTKAAKEAFQKNADIVFLQEVGSRQQFSDAAQEFGYEQRSWSNDDAVYIRPEAVEFLGNAVAGRDFASCRIRIEKTSWRVVSLRLAPPVFRLDWWNPECWREYSRDAERRRKRIAEIRQEAGPMDGQTHELIGGDFNTTNPDSMGDLNDVGRQAGRGWLGTGTNDFPLVRVDQLWSSDGLTWHQAYVSKTENSDHRMLIADFSVNR